MLIIMINVDSTEHWNTQNAADNRSAGMTNLLFNNHKPIISANKTKIDAIRKCVKTQLKKTFFNSFLSPFPKLNVI